MAETNPTNPKNASRLALLAVGLLALLLVCVAGYWFLGRRAAQPPVGSGPGAATAALETAAAAAANATLSAALVTPASGATLPGAPTAGPAQPGTPGAPGSPAGPTTAAPLPTPTGSCPPPPAGWVLHAVLPGESVYYLASSTGSSVPQIMQVNCLASDLLAIGQLLYLPGTPPVRPTFAPAVPSGAPPAAAPPAAPLPQVGLQPAAQGASTSCDSPFSCQPPQISRLLVPPGHPNQPMPCPTLARPWIHYLGMKPRQTSHTFMLGKAIYFFACGFPDPAGLKASLTGPNGILIAPPAILAHPPQPDPNQQKFFQDNPSVRALPFYPTCSLTPGSYTLTVHDAAGRQDSLTFSLTSSPKPWMSVAPETIQPGEKVTVSYCGLPASLSQLPVALYRVDTQVIPNAWSLNMRWTWPLSGGWGVQLLSSQPGDPPGAYLLLADLTSFGIPDPLQGSLWLHQP